MSSRKESVPRSLRRSLPILVTECPPPFDAEINPAACDQKRIARTMFLPTPKSTIASSSSENSFGFFRTPRTAFGSQAYRQGNVSCPEIRYGTFHFAKKPDISESNLGAPTFAQCLAALIIRETIKSYEFSGVP